MSTKNIFYAAIGAGDLAIEKARKASIDLDLASIRNEIPKNVTQLREELPKGVKSLRNEAEQVATKLLKTVNGRYEKLVKRGEKTFSAIRSSTPTKRAVDQAKVARSQTKAAVTSAKKAASEVAEATKSATTEATKVS